MIILDVGKLDVGKQNVEGRKIVTHEFKALGLTLVLIFMITGIGAPGASAQTLGTLTTASGGSVTFDGVEIGSNYFEDLAFGSKTECPGSTLTGHKLEATPHKEIPNNSREVTVSPIFVNCNAGGLLSTITMNGCDFGLTIGETTAAESSEYGVTLHIVCPPGKKIEKHIYASATSEAVPTCTYTIGSQTLNNAFDLKNDPGIKDALILTGESKEVKVERHGLCGNKTELFNLRWVLNFTISGTNSDTSSVGITVTH